MQKLSLSLQPLATGEYQRRLRLPGAEHDKVDTIRLPQQTGNKSSAATSQRKTSQNYSNSANNSTAGPIRKPRANGCEIISANAPC